MTPRRDEFWALLRAIAAHDANRVRERLEKSPHLARATEPTGARRAESAAYFLDAVKQYVYAGHTALHVAAAAYDTDIARDLVSRGADPRATNRRGATPLHCAAQGSPGSKHWNPTEQAAVIEYLIHAGADPNAPDVLGATPLHRAVRSRCAAAAGALLSRGADARRRNSSGSTPLHLAVQSTGRGGSGSLAAHEEQAKIIRQLMKHGARLTDQNSAGKTVAESIRSTRVAQITQGL